MPKPRIKAVIFDFDGTLAKTDKAMFTSFAWLVKNRKLLPKSLRSPIGLFHAMAHSDPEILIKEMYRISGRRENANEVKRTVETMERIMEENAKGAKLRRHAKMVIKQLKENNVFVAVSSLASKERVVDTLDRHGVLGHIDMILTKESSKNREKRLRRVLDELEKRGIKPEEVLVVGDMPTDVKAGRKVGAKVAIITRGVPGLNYIQMRLFKKYGQKPDFFVKSLKEVSSIVLGK